jgi:hypothetical protein
VGQVLFISFENFRTETSVEEGLKNNTLMAIKIRAQIRMAPDIKSPFFMILIEELLMLEFS